MLEELLQKLKFVLECKNEAQALRLLEQFDYFKNEKTIEFAEWLREECYDTGTHWLYQQNNEIYTSLEIFEIFKHKHYEHIRRS